jgi:hypothetical protein
MTPVYQRHPGTLRQTGRVTAGIAELIERTAQWLTSAWVLGDLGGLRRQLS